MGSTPAYILIAEQIKTQWLSNNDPLNRKKLPIQEELASHFGVSRSTIIRALSKLVAEGYLHSQQGSGVYVADAPPRSSSVSCISLIVPDIRAQVIIQACRGVERRARQLGYQVLLASSEGSLAHEKEVVEQHLQSGVKGVVLYPVTRHRTQIDIDYLVRLPTTVPVVTLDIGCEEWPCTRVHFDNYRLGFDMTQMLIKHGRRRIAFIHMEPDYLHSSIHDRRAGWEAAMNEAAIPIPPGYRGWPVPVRSPLPPPLTDTDYEAIARDVLCLTPRPDALITWNDEVAAHLTQTLLSHGIRVPEDLCITGFDNEPIITRLFRPLFPTSRPDFARLGELGVDALVGILNGERVTPRIYYYPVPVLWREPRPVSRNSGLSDGDETGTLNEMPSVAL